MRTFTIFTSVLVATVVVATPVAARLRGDGGVQFQPKTSRLEDRMSKESPMTAHKEKIPKKRDAQATLRRRASRLQQRLKRRGEEPPSAAVLMDALQNLTQLRKAKTTVTIVPQGKESMESVTWVASVIEHPEWVYLERKWPSARYIVDADGVRKLLEDPAVTQLPRAHVSTIAAVRTDEYDVERTTDDGPAKEGFTLDVKAAADDVRHALEKQKEGVTITAAYQPAIVRYPTQNGEYVELELLGSGRSNFAKSPSGRDWNVRKAINERVNNIVVQPSATLSFNDTLGVPVTLGKGWKDALAIYGGGASLAMTPGGGICQAATTVYRAALLAGLPIPKRKAHSLYVSYYELHGVGMDATIFPGKQDLAFTNDTNSVIVMQSYTEGDDAYVNIYGKRDGRRVALDGPYFSTNAERPEALAKLSARQIGWVRRITNADGTTREEPILSSYYKGIPRSIVTKYTAPATQEIALHAAAQ